MIYMVVHEGSYPLHPPCKVLLLLYLLQEYFVCLRAFRLSGFVGIRVPSLLLWVESFDQGYRLIDDAGRFYPPASRHSLCLDNTDSVNKMYPATLWGSFVFFQPKDFFFYDKHFGLLQRTKNETVKRVLERTTDPQTRGSSQGVSGVGPEETFLLS